VDVVAVLGLVALLLAAIEVARTRGQSILAWAVVALAIAAIWPSIT
jgi:hypothetical protein